jgi:hypothetical protein
VNSGKSSSGPIYVKEERMGKAKVSEEIMVKILQILLPPSPYTLCEVTKYHLTINHKTKCILTTTTKKTDQSVKK